jgi:serine/threonine-protein kinase
VAETFKAQRAKIQSRGTFWRADWFVAVLVILAVYFLYQLTDVFSTLERRYYDFASTTTSRQPSDRIAIIAIDDQSIANIGVWPWPRDVQARLIDQLAAAKAKSIINTTLFFEPQKDRGLVYINKMKDLLADPALGPNAASEQLGQVITDAQAVLDTDTLLASSMGKAANVLVPSVFKLGFPQGRADSPLPAYAAKSAVDDPNNFSIPAVSGQQPIAAIGNAAAGIGHLNQFPDVDGSIRQEPLLVNYFGKAVPSMSLLAVANSLNLGPGDIRLNAGESVQIGKLVIKTDESALMLPL